MATTSRRLTPHDALEIGNAKRYRVGEIRRKLRMGELCAAEAVDVPEIQGWTAVDFAKEVRGFGRTKLAELGSDALKLGVNVAQPIGRLSPENREWLVRWLDAPYAPDRKAVMESYDIQRRFEPPPPPKPPVSLTLVLRAEQEEVEEEPYRPGPERVDNSALREVVLTHVGRGDITLSDLAERLGYTTRDRGDTSRLQRRLGMKPEVREGKCSTTIQYELAVRIVRAMGYDPVDFDL